MMRNKASKREGVEIRGADGRLLALVSRDGRELTIKRRSTVYTVDLVATWVEGAARISSTVDFTGRKGVE